MWLRIKKLKSQSTLDVTLPNSGGKDTQNTLCISIESQEQHHRVRSHPSV